MSEKAREGLKLALTAVIGCVALWAFASFMAATFGNPNANQSNDCETDWDGRSNPTVC